jgi:membrane-bound lytic murein transglycosylase F
MELVLHSDATTEELVEMVAESEIAITVADSNIARLNRLHLPDIRSAFPLSPPKSLGWAVRKGNKELLEAINGFFRQIEKDGTLNEIYSHYYGNGDHLKHGDLRAFHELIETRMPLYRPIIKNFAREYGFDWRLITAMIYQESLFDPDARSYTGVRGLMQVTQRTADEMGISDRTDPEQSIRAGVRYLADLYRRFDDVENKENRLLLSLASYNVGYGHVRDAQELLRRTDRDPNSWPSLREALPLLGKPEYFRDTEFGYARGTEPVRYVDNVMIYYDILKRKI